MSKNISGLRAEGLWPLRLAKAVLRLFGLCCLALLAGMDLPKSAAKIPAFMKVPLQGLAGDLITYLAKEAHLGPLALRDLTRGIAQMFRYPMQILQALLAKGFGAGAMAALPWSVIALAIALIAHRLGGLRLVALALLCLGYCLFFGLWTPAMLSLASVSLSVVVGVAAGLLLGVTAYACPRLDRLLTALYDIMQTVPVLASLVPILFLFGFGPVGAMIAKVIYATPPWRGRV